MLTTHEIDYTLTKPECLTGVLDLLQNLSMDMHWGIMAFEKGAIDHQCTLVENSYVFFTLVRVKRLTKSLLIAYSNSANAVE